MNRNITNSVVFAMGVAVGSIATWLYARKKYEKIAQEEIDSVKEVFSKRRSEDMSKKHDEPGATVNTASNYTEYENILEKEGYVPGTEGKEGESMSDVPYIITPDEFGELDDYDTVSLTYYIDGVLTDEMDEVIDDINGLVGLHSLNHFGEYEDDSVFVRNDERMCDYEILLDQRNYSDVVKETPGGMRSQP